MTSVLTPANNQSQFNGSDDFHLQPEPDLDSYSDEPDLFADSHIDGMVEATEMRSANSFNRSIDSGAVPTRRPKSSRRASANRNDKSDDYPDGKSGAGTARRNSRTTITIALALFAIIGLLAMLLLSASGSGYPYTSVEIKIAPPPVINYPVYQPPPAPPRHAPVRPVKMPPKPQAPALLSSTDPIPIPTPPITTR